VLDLNLSTFVTEMKLKGYIMIGVQDSTNGMDDFRFTLVLVHKDWTTYNFQKQFDQAWKDIPEILTNDPGLFLEIPTREMFEKRYAKKNPFDMLYDGR
jgi:hypothetical protein